MDPLPQDGLLGQTLGSYKVTGTIGRGGMGKVYLAQHSLLGRPAAVKVLLPAYSQDQETVNRFFNEARAATAVRHLGIVEIYDFGFHTDGSAYIAMELLEGESLASRLARGRLSVPVALAITRQIAGVLAAAHAKGIVHRDLKPDNIFIVPDAELATKERVKLLDFGIAKLTQQGGEINRTRTGAVMGTPPYMSPEQCRGVTVDHRADLYALGCILFEMVTGRVPFAGGGAIEMLAAHIYIPAPLLTTVVPDAPASATELTRRLLEKDPAARLQSSEDVIAAIDGATDVVLAFRTGQDLPSPQSPAAEPGEAAVATWRPAGGRTGRRIALAIAGAGGLGAAVAAIWLAVRPADVEERPAGDDGLVVVPTVAADAGVPTVAATPPPPVDAAPAPLAPTFVDVAIDSAPRGARVVIGRSAVGSTPYRGRLPRGDASVPVTLTLDGHEAARFALLPTAAVTRKVVLKRCRNPFRC